MVYNIYKKLNQSTEHASQISSSTKLFVKTSKTKEGCYLSLYYGNTGRPYWLQYDFK